MNKTKQLVKKLGKLALAEQELLYCGARRNGYGCTRPKGHKGYHIAMGTERLYELWFGDEFHERNAAIKSVLDELFQEVAENRRSGSNCGEETKDGWQCSRGDEHDRLHIALGSVVDAIWRTF